MRTPSTGREVVIEAEPGETYLDRETGEEMEVVGQLLPLAPTPSELPWSIENLRFCNWCDQLVQKDLNDCPHCGTAHGSPALLVSAPPPFLAGHAWRPRRGSAGGGSDRRLRGRRGHALRDTTGAPALTIPGGSAAATASVTPTTSTSTTATTTTASASTGGAAFTPGASAAGSGATSSAGTQITPASGATSQPATGNSGGSGLGAPATTGGGGTGGGTTGGGTTGGGGTGPVAARRQWRHRRHRRHGRVRLGQRRRRARLGVLPAEPGRLLSGSQRT